MSRYRFVAMSAAVFVVVQAFVHAQETDLKAVVRKAIEAHGGEKELAKMNAAVSKYKGTMKIMGQTLDITGENSFQKPDKLRVVTTINAGGKSFDVVTVYDGTTLWVAAGGKTTEVKDPKVVDEVKQSILTEVGAGMLEILKEPFELSSIGEAKVKGKDTVGIRVSKKGQRDISYYFDKKTHLLAKTESRSLDTTNGQEVTQEKIVVEYGERNNMKVAKRMEILKDGELFMDLEILDLQAHDKLDMGLFAKP